jgi:Asp-tRNA(Asn)/Glu-tRNA(Gln) amidotransferase B subunit
MSGDNDMDENLKRTVNAVLEKYDDAREDYLRGVDAAEDFLVRKIMINSLGGFNAGEVKEAIKRLAESYES